MLWADASDVLDAWIGEDAPSDVALINTWVDKAEREIRFRVPDLESRIQADESGDLERTAIDVVVAMVIRKFQNPRGIRQTNITTGPFTGSETYGGDLPGGLGLTDDELAKLRGQVSRGAFTVSMIPTSSPFYGSGHAAPHF